MSATGRKWSPEFRAKYTATIAARRAAARLAAAPPVKRQRRSPNEAEDFARFMAAAWKLYKRGHDGR